LRFGVAIHCTTMKVTTKPVAELSAEERAELDDLALRCFGPPERRPSHPLTIASDDDLKYSVRCWADDGRLASCLWITERRILSRDGRRSRPASVGCAPIQSIDGRATGRR
jgi:hypothetical protein